MAPVRDADESMAASDNGAGDREDTRTAGPGTEREELNPVGMAHSVSSLLPPRVGSPPSATSSSSIAPISKHQRDQQAIHAMLDQLRLTQSPDEKRFNQIRRTIDKLHTRLFCSMEQYRAAHNDLMHWREQLVMCAPHLVAACFSQCRAAIGGSADLSPANGHGATGPDAIPMLLADDHLGGDTRYVTRRRTQLVQTANLTACRDIERVLDTLAEEVRASHDELTLIREALFDVCYESSPSSSSSSSSSGGDATRANMLAQNVELAKEKHRKSMMMAVDLLTKTEQLLANNRQWLQNIVAGLAHELAADVFYDV